MNPLGRLFRWIDERVTTRLDRHIETALDGPRRVTTSVAPLLAPYHLDVNPRTWPCCPCCGPSCPQQHRDACDIHQETPA